MFQFLTFSFCLFFLIFFYIFYVLLFVINLKCFAQHASPMPPPRKLLSSKKRKHSSLDETEAMLLKLKALKAEKAARVLVLSRIVLKAMKEIVDIESEMDLQAAMEIHDDYINCVPDFKLTFEAVYAQHAEEADDPPLRVADCLDIFHAIQDDAASALNDS